MLGNIDSLDFLCKIVLSSNFPTIIVPEICAKNPRYGHNISTTFLTFFTLTLPVGQCSPKSLRTISATTISFKKMSIEIGEELFELELRQINGRTKDMAKSTSFSLLHKIAYSYHESVVFAKIAYSYHESVVFAF